jgi:hypothetical protein
MDRMVGQVMHKHHASLETNKIKIGTVFVETDADETTGAVPPALTDHGMPCAAKIRLAPTRDRILHGYDAVLEIDALEWEGLSGQQRTALIDHELTHVCFKSNKEGEYVRDAYGRPKLELRPHDWEVSGFDAVVQRHKGDAVEALNFRRVQRNHQIGGQGVFDFMLDQVVKDAGKELLSPTGADKKTKGVASVVAQIPGCTGHPGTRKGRSAAASVTIDKHNKGRIAANIDKVLKTSPRKTRAAAAGSGKGASRGKGRSKKAPKRK